LPDVLKYRKTCLSARQEGPFIAVIHAERVHHPYRSEFVRKKDMIHLEKIDSTNIWEIVDLRVFKSQKNFVAENWKSIVQAYGVRDSATAAFPFAIYKDKRPVGFLMIGFNEAAMYENWDDVEAPQSLVNNYSIWRLMIDKRYQKRGYGREAIKLALNFIRTWPCGKAEYCSLSYEPENEVARELYRSLGFMENGEMDGEEIVAILKL
jgi:diamine N-acetyltransferase